MGSVDVIRVRSRRWPRRLLSATGAAVAVVVTAAFAAMAVLPMFGLRTMIVSSGSMAPTFHPGDAIVVQEVDPARVNVGDLITFTGYGTERLTTHRVVSLHDVNGALHFRTKGDANPDPDANLAPAAGLQGQVQLVLPHVGRVLDAMAGRYGMLLILGLPALILAAVQLRAIVASARTASGGVHRSGILLVIATVLMVATVAGATLVRTMATFTDTHAAGGNTFTTSAFGSG